MSTPLWTASDAAAATGGRATVDWRASGVSIDSRTLVPGDLFVALVGPNADGHDHVAAALAAGAAAALVHRRPERLPGNAPLLEVDDTFKALHALGAAARARSRARIAAVTGSVGKTGTKEALRRVLEAQAPTAASQGNLNNHWGAPLSLARMAPEAVYGAFELGMNHPGEIAPLSRLVRPHVALVTVIAPAHMAFFPSLDAVADAKAEIFEGIEAGGVAVLNRDDARFERLAAAARHHRVGRILSFGRAADADARVLDASVDAGGSDVVAAIDGRRVRYRIGAPGAHWLVNSVAVLAAVVALGADLDAAAQTLADVDAPAGRGRQRRLELPGGSVRLIDESYNSSPAAVRAALDLLALVPPGPGGRRIAVLGDMLELGDDAPAQHAALADELVARGIDGVYAAGPCMERLFGALPPSLRGAHAPDTARLGPIVATAVRPGDVVLVKGSLGMQMSRVLAALTALETAPASNEYDLKG